MTRRILLPALAAVATLSAIAAGLSPTPGAPSAADDQPATLHSEPADPPRHAPVGGVGGGY